MNANQALAIKAAVAYAALVMMGGFVMGVLRELLLIPAFGHRPGQLLEAPLMLLVIFLSASFTMRRISLQGGTRRKAAMGLASLGVVLLAELALSPLVRGSIQAWIESFTPLSLSIAISLWIAHAAMPLVVKP